MISISSSIMTTIMMIIMFIISRSRIDITIISIINVISPP